MAFFLKHVYINPKKSVLYYGMLFLGFTALSWYVNSLFAFAAWTAFFFLLNTKIKPTQKLLLFFGLLFLNNFIVLFWLLDCNLKRGLIAILLNTAFLWFPLLLFFTIVPIIKKYKHTFFICIWISFELFYHYWSLSFTWLTIGNVFSINTVLIQWYSITGVLGGSLWVLLVSLWFYKYLTKKNRKSLTFAALILLIPVITSFLLLRLNAKKNNQKQLYISTLYTNLANSDSILQRNLITNSISMFNKTNFENINYLITPEVFLKEQWMNSFKEGATYLELKKIAKKYPALKMIHGVIMNEITDENTKKSMAGLNYKTYNAAIQIDSSNLIPIKVKKKYVPLSEFVPNWLSFLNINSADDSEMPNNRNVIDNKTEKPFISICYEAINSIFFAENIEDANLIIMLASESFLNNNKTGMTQYFNICKLRAIETRKQICKVSNSGISGVINIDGSIQSKYYESNANIKLLSFALHSNNSISFYSLCRGYINFFYPFCALIILFLNLKSFYADKNYIRIT